MPSHSLSDTTYLTSLGKSTAGSAADVARQTAVRIGQDPSIGTHAGQVNPRKSIAGESWEDRRARSAEAQTRIATRRAEAAKQAVKDAKKRKATADKAAADRRKRDRIKAETPKNPIGRPKKLLPENPAPKRPRGRPKSAPIGKAEVIARVQARENDRINKKNSNK
jgi:hypothetical protein